jgi:hypothetical protein
MVESFGAYGFGYAMLPGNARIITAGGRRSSVMWGNCSAYQSDSAVWVSRRPRPCMTS